jgi:WD40 repeat protein
MTLRWGLLVCALACGLALAAGGRAQAQAPPPQEPFLRIDPAMHTAPIRRIGSDPACTLLATASDDKTVRLWRMPEGKPLRVLRPPIGPGNDGRAYATAVAPDRSWVAVGIDASGTVLRGDVVYVFNASSGAIEARFGPLSNGITHLAVSPDGRYLAGTLLRGEGVRVWERTGSDLARWRLVTEDKSYNGDTYGAAFDRTGVLYVVSYDGTLRRYAPPYTGRSTSVATRGGKRPYTVAPHPYGDRVAVSFADAPTVDIYHAATLAWGMAPDTKDLLKGDLGAVAWSADGQRLYAGGTFARVEAGVDKGSPVFVWDRAGFGPRSEVAGPQDTVLHLIACGSNVAVAGADPAFGLIGPDGRRRLWQEGTQPDLRGQRADKSVAVATDGRRVRFRLDDHGGSWVLFDLANEQLTESPAPLADLGVADTNGLPIADWINNRAPKLNGVPIKLANLETSRSVAIAPGRQKFVLGTEWNLLAFDKEGVALWRKHVPGATWSLNISRDGNFAVAGYGDGTVRWHRMSDGQELLALFVHKGDRRWVAWTPKGYYMASPGAESLIGWHVNRTWDKAADFYPADRFRDQFNRPDIVRMVLATLDEGRAIEDANRRANVPRVVENVRAIAPPTVIVQKPSDNASFSNPEVTIEYHAFSPTGKRITDVDVRVNNASIGARAAVPINPRGNDPIRITLTLPQQDVIITLVAREGTRASEPATVRLRWDGAQPGKAQRPKLRALFVGVNEYTAPDLPKLRFAAKDARDLAAFFKSQEGRSYSKVLTKVLADGKRADVLDGLEWLEKGSEETDVNLLFLAGHGITDEQQHFYYMAADSDPERPRATGVSRNEIVQTIRNRKGTMVVMVDACHSGDTAGTVKRQSRVDMNRLVNEFGDKSLGVFLYASALGRQFSYEHADWQNGAFTKAMLEGLSGMADREKLGYVETDELAVYVRRQVLRMTKGMQEPVRMKPDAAPEMRIVLLR